MIDVRPQKRQRPWRAFDAAIAEMGDNVIEIKNIAGDPKLGGHDIDISLVELINKKIETINAQQTSYSVPLCERYDRRIETMKISLNDGNSATLDISDITTGEGNSISISISISVQEFEYILEPFLRKAAVVIEKLVNLTRSSRFYTEVRTVVFAGQGCKIRSFRKTVQRYFPDAAIIDRYQESAVVRGLSHQAAVLSGNVRSLLLLDVFHWKIGTFCNEISHEERLQPPGYGGRR